MIGAKVILDSLANNGKRLTTIEVTMHRFVLAEFNTHRMFSRNAASSRAIPVDKRIEAVKNNPAMPVEWGKNKKGMQAEEVLSHEAEAMAKVDWLMARDACVAAAWRMKQGAVHKQIANRLIEPWSWVTDVVTATEWNNFRFVRVHKDAQPEFQVAARAMMVARDSSTPTLLADDQWHTPYILPEEYKELDDETRKRVSVARCARVSTLTHDGRRDIAADLQLFDRLTSRENPETDPGHWSPVEHVARPIPHIKFTGPLLMCEWCGGHSLKWSVVALGVRQRLWTCLCHRCALGHVTSGNFFGWHQFRKDFATENAE